MREGLGVVCVCVRAHPPAMHVHIRVGVECWSRCRCECSCECVGLCPSLSPGEEAVHKGLCSSRGLFKFGAAATAATTLTQITLKPTESRVFAAETLQPTVRILPQVVFGGRCRFFPAYFMLN